VAAALALAVTPGRHGARGFIVTTSGVNTANTVFALFALVALGSPRTGVLVALERSDVPLDLPVLLAAVALGAVVGFLLVPRLGDRYLRLVGRVSYARLSLAVLGLLVVLSGLLAGLLGVGLLAAAALVGHVPVALGARRANLMGVLVWPLVLG
jgi:putative membrane protein